MTVRNIRAYQARGLLPPPVVDGRVGFYTQAHRERLTMIRRLRSEGFNLVAISALLTGVVPVTDIVVPFPGTSLAAGRDPTGRADADDNASGLPDAGAALLALGVPVDAVLALHREVADVAEQVAQAYTRVYDEYVRGPWVQEGSPERRRQIVLDARGSLPGIAVAAVAATLVPAVRRSVDQAAVSISERPT